MSVLIKDMEKPKSCYAVIDGESEYCPFVNTDDDCVLLFKKGICEETWEEQYSKCPLVEVTEPCEDAVSRAAVIDLIEASDLDLADRMDNQAVCSFVKMIPSVTPKQGPLESDEAAKRLNDLISDINPWEICSQIESDNLSDWCKTIQTEMKMAMVQCKELGIDDSGKQVEFYIWEDKDDES